MNFNVKEDIIALTPKWTGERMPDGRPFVADKYLKALLRMTLEEVWKPIFVLGYECQFEGRLQTLHRDGRKLVGRAVTCTFCPTCPDLHEVALKMCGIQIIRPIPKPPTEQNSKAFSVNTILNMFITEKLSTQNSILINAETWNIL